MSKLRSRLIMPLVATTILAVACGDRKDEASPPDTTAGTAGPAETAVQAPREARVVEVALGRAVNGEGELSQPADSFGVHDTVYAVVRSRGAGHLDLKAVWRYDDGQVISENARSIEPTGPATTEFHVLKATPWPAGDYAVEILANGRSVDMKQFKIR